MSLDVYLERKLSVTDLSPPEDQRKEEIETECVFDANITHNLTEMAEKAGLYGVVWRPEENGIERASQMIDHLEQGVAKLKSDPTYFQQFDASNGWGRYIDFVPWLERYLEACRTYPYTTVRVSR